MAQKIEKVFCPSCGAPVKFLDGREDTFCTHCGHQLFREDTNLELKFKHEEEMGRQDVEIVKQHVKLETEKNAHKEYNMEAIGAIALMVVAVLFATIIFLRF